MRHPTEVDHPQFVAGSIFVLEKNITAFEETENSNTIEMRKGEIVLSLGKMIETGYGPECLFISSRAGLIWIPFRTLVKFNSSKEMKSFNKKYEIYD